MYQTRTMQYHENLRFRVYRFEIEVFVSCRHSHRTIECIFFVTTLCGKIQILVRPAQKIDMYSVQRMD